MSCVDERSGSSERAGAAGPPPPGPPSTGDRIRLLLVSFGGLGLAPIAPGTFGTFGGVALALPLPYGPWPVWVSASLLVVLLVLTGAPLGRWAERHYGLEDPGAMVLDEVAGYLTAVALFDAVCGVPLGFGGHAAAFLFFRAADILKPPPARRLERIRGGYGIMLDDLAAGLYAGALLVLVAWGRPGWL